jgi:hypothetical protein
LRRSGRHMGAAGMPLSPCIPVKYTMIACLYPALRAIFRPSAARSCAITWLANARSGRCPASALLPRPWISYDHQLQEKEPTT